MAGYPWTCPVCGQRGASAFGQIPPHNGCSIADRWPATAIPGRTPDNRPTMEERRLAKQAAWRASQGLPPKGEKPKPTRKPRRFVRWEDRVRDPLDERDNLGESSDY